MSYAQEAAVRNAQLRLHVRNLWELAPDSGKRQCILGADLAFQFKLAGIVNHSANFNPWR